MTRYLVKKTWRIKCRFDKILTRFALQNIPILKEMEKIKDIIARYLPFAWWVFLALPSLSACVCCSAQAACGFGVFWATIGAIGAGLSVVIYGVQAWGEWVDRYNE